MHIYLEHLTTMARFEVMEYDKETKMAKLRGEYGAQFSRDISKESLARLGYKIIKSEEVLPLRPKVQPVPPKAKVDDDEAPPPPPKKKAKVAVAAEVEEE